ncbi:MAG: hypothetical protein ACRYG7_47430 [Janthinobacterium lividum]
MHHQFTTAYVSKSSNGTTNGTGLRLNFIRALASFFATSNMATLGLLVLSLFAKPASAQNIDWEWKAQSVGYDNISVAGTTLDKQGNSYVTGRFRGKVSFGTTQLVSQGRSDLFVAKLTAQGAWAWAKSAGGEEIDRATAIVADTRGNLYVAGSFSQKLTLGKTTLASRGGQDCFVAKMNSNGQWTWAKSVASTAGSEATSLVLDNRGEVVVAGRFTETASVGTGLLISHGDGDAFVAKLSSKGVWRWSTSLGGVGNDIISAIATTKTGELYVTGFSHGATLDATTTKKPYIVQAFVAKLNAGGERQWLAEVVGEGTSYGKAIAVNSEHQVFVTGSLSGTATFGSATLNSYGGDDAFVAQLDDQGQWQWICTMGSDVFDTGTAIAVNELGNVCVAGTFGHSIRHEDTSLNLTSHGGTDIFLTQFTTRGKMVSSAAVGSEADDGEGQLAIDAAGNCQLTGICGGNLQLGTLQVKMDSPQVIIVRFRPNVFEVVRY